VEAFLRGRIGFTAIAEVVAETLSRLPGRRASGIAEVLEIDRQSRATAYAIVAERAGAGAASA